MTSAVTQRLAKLAVEGLFIACAALSVFLVIALSTYHSADPGWSYFGNTQMIYNSGGKTGAWIADVLLLLFGYVAYLIPIVLAYRTALFFKSVNLFESTDWAGMMIFIIGLVLLFMSLCSLTTMHSSDRLAQLPNGSGGLLGLVLAKEFVYNFGMLGAKLIFFSIFFIGITFTTNLSWLKLSEQLGRAVVVGLPLLCIKCFGFMRGFSGKIKEHMPDKLPSLPSLPKPSLPERKEKAEPTFVEPSVRTEPKMSQEPVVSAPLASPKEAPLPIVEPSKRVMREKQKKLFINDDPLPEITELLNAPSDVKRGYSQETLDRLSRLLEEKLLDFRVEVTVTDVFPGPVVTRFEIEPKPGTKVSTINNLSKDIARSLAVVSVRVVDVIAGKSVIGIEIPNNDREIVYFSEVIGSKAFDEATSPLTLVLGKDIGGHPVVSDLAKMPHLLVAGTTGSGKSVGVNAMILSLLFKSTPEEVRLILVDPKMLELSVYEGIPHLLAPVITDMKDAANGLRWCVGEMERRYKLMSKLGVRNIAGFNKKVKDAKAAAEPLLDPLWVPDELFEGEQTAPELDTLPFIVIIIDEFADMMMVVGKKVEELIARIAQKARAAGIHLVLATQRPSVDVITGLIKANVPTRIAFQVSSKIDSRTILDQGGAEQLLGHGDMLFLPPGTSLLTRVHGAFVDDDEVHRVVAAWKAKGEPDYIEDLTEEGSNVDIPGFTSESSEGDPESDPLYDEAVAFVIESRKASISAVQRKLRIGYNRAARMIEDMEAAGVVSEMSGSGQREVLVPPQS